MYSWHLPANFLVLRIISFACDDHWAALAVNGAKKEDAELALVNNRGTADLAKRNDSDGDWVEFLYTVQLLMTCVLLA